MVLLTLATIVLYNGRYYGVWIRPKLLKAAQETSKGIETSKISISSSGTYCTLIQ